MNSRSFWISVTLVAIMWAGSAVCAVTYFGDAKDSGPWGDTFGAVNALFTGLGFAGLWYTIRLQHHEIEEASKDAKSTSHLNALIALAQHSGRAYDRAVILQLPQEIEGLAVEYDWHLSQLRKLVEEEHPQPAMGFATLERMAAAKPKLVFQIVEIACCGSQNTAIEPIPTFSITLRVENSSSAPATLKSVVLYLQVEKEMLKQGFEFQETRISGYGTATLRATTPGIYTFRDSLPKAVLLIARIAERAAPFREVFNSAWAERLEGDPATL